MLKKVATCDSFSFLFYFYNMKSKIVLLFLLVGSYVASYGQKVIGDCTISYNILVDKNGTSEYINNARKTVYIKGKHVRTDLVSPSFSQTIIFNNSTGEAVVLKEVGANKYISTFDGKSWKEKNKQFENIRTTFSDEYQKILGYDCRKATSTLKDGKTIIIYYTTAIVPSTQENPYEFKNIPGIVLQYQSELEGANQTVTFQASKLDLSPVPMSKYDIPKSGYRVL